LICLFGGTFDPVHQGHIHGALQVCEALDLDVIHLVLSARPGHRDKPGAAAEHRWRMLELACAVDARLQPDDRELRRAARGLRPSYTVETLEELRRQAPTAVLLWVLGSDAFLDLRTWHRWRDVLDLAHLVVLQRPGAPLVLDEMLQALVQGRRLDGPPVDPAGGILFLDAPMQDVSASRVRAILAAGGEIDHLLPAAVYTYIKSHGLYGVPSDP
jgi:nicotinate-nucleotide adenylyltransferase